MISVFSSSVLGQILLGVTKSERFRQTGQARIAYKTCVLKMSQVSFFIHIGDRHHESDFPIWMVLHASWTVHYDHALYGRLEEKNPS